MSNCGACDLGICTMHGRPVIIRTDDDFVAGGVWFEQCDNEEPHEQHRLPDGGNTWCKGVEQ